MKETVIQQEMKEHIFFFIKLPAALGILAEHGTFIAAETTKIFMIENTLVRSRRKINNWDYKLHTTQDNIRERE